MRKHPHLASLLLTLALTAHAQSPGTGINLNHATPASPSGARNVTFQNDSSAPTRNVSAYVTYPTVQVACPSGSDLSTAVNACLASLPSPTGGICDARACSQNFTWNNATTFSGPNQALLLPCGTLTATATVSVSPTVRNSTIHGCAYQGGSVGSGTAGGSVWNYQGSGSAFVVGDPSGGSDTPGFFMSDMVVATANAGTSAHAIDFHRTQEIDIERIYFIGDNGTGQTGITLDGTGNYSGGGLQNFRLSGFGTGLLMTGNSTGAANASTFTRMHLNCPTSGGSPIAGTTGINLAYGDGNTFVGGDIEGCDTMLSLGAGATNNTMNGVRNENSNSQVTAASGSSYNLWLTGGTMFTGKLTDNGTHNSFVDTFHRSWNNLNGDLWRSQADATVTNRVYTGIGLGNVRGLQQEWQTDVPGSPASYQEAWLWGPGDGTSGLQLWSLEDLLNSVQRFGVQQYTTAGGNDQTFLNAAGSGGVCFQCSSNSGTGGVAIGSGGASPTTVATFDNAGNLALLGNQSFIAGGQTQWVWECASSTVCALHNSAASTPANVFRAFPGAATEIDSQGTSAVNLNNTSTAGTGGFSVYYGGATYYNTAIFRIVPNGSGTAVYQLPSIAATSGHYCLQADTSGYLSNTGAACGTGSGSGSVTSVGLSLPAEFNVTVSPVTSSGTLTAAWASVAANLFFAGPTSGGSAPPALRYITAADVPTLNQSTSGNAATATAPQTTPTPCTGGQFSTGDLSTFEPDCAAVTYADLTGTVPTWNQSTTGNAATATTTTGNAATATGPQTVPTACLSGDFSTGDLSTFEPNCAAVTYADLTGTVPTWNQSTTGTAAGITPAASIQINNSSGANYVCINCANNSGTSGFYVENGTGSSPTVEFSVTGSGNTTATGFLASKGWFGNYAATFTAGAAAGSSPTIGCLSGHTCTNIQGTVSIHTGTATLTGTLVTVNFNHTQNNDLDCNTNLTLAGVGNVNLFEAVATTTGLAITVDTTPLTASTTYLLTYTCGSY